MGWKMGRDSGRGKGLARFVRLSYARIAHSSYMGNGASTEWSFERRGWDAGPLILWYKSSQAENASKDCFHLVHVS